MQLKKLEHRRNNSKKNKLSRLKQAAVAATSFLTFTATSSLTAAQDIKIGDIPGEEPKAAPKKEPEPEPKPKKRLKNDEGPTEVNVDVEQDGPPVFSHNLLFSDEQRAREPTEYEDPDLSAKTTSIKT